jgi:hypothetical protein
VRGQGLPQAPVERRLLREENQAEVRGTNLNATEFMQ